MAPFGRRNNAEQFPLKDAADTRHELPVFQSDLSGLSKLSSSRDRAPKAICMAVSAIEHANDTLAPYWMLELSQAMQSSVYTLNCYIIVSIVVVSDTPQERKRQFKNTLRVRCSIAKEAMGTLLRDWWAILGITVTNNLLHKRNIAQLSCQIENSERSSPLLRNKKICLQNDQRSSSSK